MFLFDVGVIGTAFRKNEADALTKELFEIMSNDFNCLCSGRKWRTCISGGAAGSDHLGVIARLGGVARSLTLCVPGRFDVKACQFVETDENGKAVYYKRDVDTANYYHRQFKEKTGIDSLAQIKDLIEKEMVTIRSYNSFVDRNKVIANHARYLVAYTFGQDQPGSSGTMHTWRMHEYAGNGVRIHRSIPELGEDYPTTPTDNETVINNFHEEGVEFLSNFYPVAIRVDGELYNSVEHAYQAMKTSSLEERIPFQLGNSYSTAGQAKRAGRKLTLPPDWEEKKLSIMEHLLRQKFTQHPELREKLKATAPKVLIEGNNWGDTYWGVYDGIGENQLGKLLMKIRSEI